MPERLHLTDHTDGQLLDVQPTSSAGGLHGSSARLSSPNTEQSRASSSSASCDLESGPEDGAARRRSLSQSQELITQVSRLHTHLLALHVKT